MSLSLSLSLSLSRGKKVMFIVCEEIFRDNDYSRDTRIIN